MPPSRYQHLTLTRIQTSQPRRKRSGGGGASKRDHTTHAPTLTQATQDLVEAFAVADRQRPTAFDPALIFRANLADIVTEADWRGAGLTVLSTEPNKATILFADDEQLQEFQQRIVRYGGDIPAGQKHPSYKWLGAIDTLELWGREHRIGHKLRATSIEPAGLYTVDVELWYFDSREACRQRLDELKQFMRGANQQYLDEYLGSSLCLARVRVTGAVVEQLLQVDIVATIDLPPQADLSVTSVFQKELDDFAPISSPPANAPRLCVIDSGLERGHPMLGPAVGDTSAVPASIGTSLDRAGHGTRVAGVALYGDMAEGIQSGRFNPELMLFSVRVTNDDGQFDDETLLVNQIREAVEQMHEGYSCRVFNLSLGDPTTIFTENSYPTHWATILDELAREKDIIIVVSTGNYYPPVDEKDPDALIRSYPSYLFDAAACLADPAMAVNVLTVGSLAHSHATYFVERQPNDPAYLPIAQTNQPSPFTRRGPGVESAIKPDLCDYGGNLVYDGRMQRIIRDPGAGVVSAHHEFGQGRLFTFDAGSSYAAPRVAHQAARVLGQYPQASANLVRALLVASAEIPTEVKECLGFQSSDEKQRLLQICGYGKADLEHALFSSSNRVVLFREETLEIDHFHLYEIPIPDEFKQLKGVRRISATLAFDPPIRRTRRDYIGNRMSFKLIRGKTADEIVANYHELSEKGNQFSAGATTNTLWPNYETRHSGTVQKGMLEIKSSRALAYDSPFYLVVWAEGRWAAQEYTTQNYAVVVTLEFEEHATVNLYEIMRARVALPVVTRIRI
ncbi:MAG: S8 family peptidase [Caldilineaceae bacterium]